jgi:hypothetical protein
VTWAHALNATLGLSWGTAAALTDIKIPTKLTVRYDMYDVLPFLAAVLLVLSSHLLVLRLPHLSCTCVTCLSHLSYILSPSSVRAVSVVYGVTPYCLLGLYEPHFFALRKSSNITLSKAYREFQQLPRNCCWYHFPLFVIIVIVIVIFLLVFLMFRYIGVTRGEEGKQITNSSIFST